MKKFGIYFFCAFFLSTSLTSCGGDDGTTGGGRSQSTGVHNGHQWVDLGLSMKWATCNVGASKPYEFGNYFSLGETTGYDEGKKEFTRSTYKWYEEGKGYIKYCCSSDKGIVDNKYIVDKEDDAASANWGGNWRLPHPSEVAELMNNCYWEWTNSYDNSGVKGVIVYKAKTTTDKGIYCNESKTVMPSSKYTLSDTHIFLPAAGEYDLEGYSATEEGEGSATGVYLTSSFGHEKHSISLTYYYFENYTGEALDGFIGPKSRCIGDWGAHYGFSVRAVCPK